MIDDDIHLEGWPAIFEDVFYRTKDLTHATLYDHPDKYTERYKRFTNTFNHVLIFSLEVCA